MGVLSREKRPLQQFHSKKAGGRIFEGGLIFGDYGIYTGGGGNPFTMPGTVLLSTQSGGHGDEILRI